MTAPTAAARILRVDGVVLDAAAADRLAKALSDATPDADVAIDLSDVRTFDDFAVMVLARALTGRTGHVSVRGLRQHHVRLLRYLGIDSDETPRASA
jgi:anti-anti-sigma regulatory factor